MTLSTLIVVYASVAIAAAAVKTFVDAYREQLAMLTPMDPMRVTLFAALWPVSLACALGYLFGMVIGGVVEAREPPYRDGDNL